MSGFAGKKRGHGGGEDDPPRGGAPGKKTRTMRIMGAPPALAFPNVRSGGIGPARPVVLTNISGEPVKVEKVAESGATKKGEFDLRTDGFELAPWESKTTTMLFVPAERFVARWLADVLPDVQVVPHERLRLGTDLGYDVDIVVRDPTSGGPLAVLDTKYKDHARPDAADVQQVVFYATVRGCAEACLVYPRPVESRVFAAGPVTVRTIGIDLAALPAIEAAAERQLDLPTDDNYIAPS